MRKLAPLIVPVTIQAIAGSEDIIDAMDLRAFGVQPRTWLEPLSYRMRDRVLIAAGVAGFLFSLALSIYGVGSFWIPQALKALPLM